MYPDNPGIQSLSLRWTGADRRSGIEALLRIHEARNWKAFRGALRRYPGPVATFMYADREGTIGTQLAGLLPIRSIETGLLPVPGRSRYYDWRGFIAFDDLPRRSGKNLDWLVVTPHAEGFKAS